MTYINIGLSLTGMEQNGAVRNGFNRANPIGQRRSCISPGCPIRRCQFWSRRGSSISRPICLQTQRRGLTPRRSLAAPNLVGCHFAP